MPRSCCISWGERWHMGLIFPSFLLLFPFPYLPYMGFIHSCAFSLEPVTTALIQIMGPAQARACAVIYGPFLLLSFGVGGGSGSQHLPWGFTTTTATTTTTHLFLPDMNEIFHEEKKDKAVTKPYMY